MADPAFGAELRRLRTTAGMSLSELANRIHYSKGYLSKVETGTAQPNQTLASLCDDVLESEGVLVAVVPQHRRQRGRPRGPAVRIAGLPADVAHYTGRADQLAELRAVLRADEPTAPATCVVHGMAGVGKTAFAVHGAHQVEDDFPDGCLFLDLRGYRPDSPEVSSAEALDRLLRLLGLPGERIPAELDDRAAFYRGALRGRRFLIVLDNAASARQVAPLLPAEHACRVLVTSRNRLPALDDAHHIALDVLSEAEASALFGSVSGGGPTAASDRVASVVRRCGWLPLAVRIAAARYRGNPAWSLMDLAERLSDESALLDELDDGERSVAAALALSYRGLPGEQRRLLGLLAQYPGADLDVQSAAALGGLPVTETSRLVERLRDAHLLIQQHPGRYEFHDLLRLFAQRTAHRQLAEDERQAALLRLVEHALHAVETAETLLTPLRFRPAIGYSQLPPAVRTFAGADAAVAWLRTDWPNLVAVCRLAAEHGLHRQCWQIAYLLRGFFFLTKLWDPWIQTHTLALDSARACGDRWAEGATLNNLGVAHIDRGRIDLAWSCYQEALAVFGALGDEHGRVTALANLGWAQHYRGEHEAARRDLGAALEFYRRAGAERNVAITLRGIALAETDLGAHADAVGHATEALGILDAAGPGQDVAMALNCLGWAHFRAGDHDRSAAAYREAVARGERAGSSYEVARAETGLGNIAAAQDRPAEARRYWDLAEEHHPGLDATMVGERRLRAAR
ncbi:MAG TPA: tetratricopeptide repeat protein [Pseudonocardiaceae bacterium]|nr:tetratricopeptide repeat protein [Pseudonocardiaceae bacterium]